MSHFTVLVTNTHDEHHETQLEPFYEQGDETEYFMEKEIVCEYDNVPAQAKRIVDDVKQMHKKAVEMRRAAKRTFKETDDWAADKQLERRLEMEAKYDNHHLELAEKYQSYIDAGDSADVIQDWEGGSVDDEGNVYHLSNPNAKWDWYVVGGRWSGYFVKKDGADGELGEPGVLMDRVTDSKLADVIKVKDIDWDAMDAKVRKERAELYDKYHGDGEKPHVWNIDDLDKMSRDEYINQPISHSTFAVLHDNEWYERGSMGWWGMVSDEKNQVEWDAKFRELIESLDPEAEVTIVDCHI